MGCKGVSKIAVEIRAERSSPRIESGTNCRGSVGKLEGVCQSLSCDPVFGWRGCSVLRDYRHRLPFGTACYKSYSVEIMMCSWHPWIYSTPFRRALTFSWPLVSLRPAREMSLGRWLLVIEKFIIRQPPKGEKDDYDSENFLVACFSSVKNHNVSGPHLFPSLTTCQKNPFATPRTVLSATASKKFTLQ